MKGNLFRLPFVCLKCFHICAILLKSLFTGLIGCFFFIRVFQHINFLNTHLSVGGYRYGKRDIQIRLRIADTRCIYNALRSCFIIYDSFEHGLCQEVNTGRGLKMHDWMRGYLTYGLPLIVLFIFVFGLYDKFID